MNVVSYGGGVNSTAMLIGMKRHYGMSCDAILFADTGGEMPGTYKFLQLFNEWLILNNMPRIIRVNNAGRPDFPHKSLEDECLNNKTLPSLAFGFRGCSTKWKRQPMDRYLVRNPMARTIWRSGNKVTRLIGIDAGEQHRGKIPDCNRFTYRFPLIEWGWAREECISAIAKEGLPVPPKSACFFCPAMRKAEVLALTYNNPSLFKRAVALEHNARESLGVVKGLGRRWSWEDLAKADAAQEKLFPDMLEQPCMCFDGDSDE